MFRSKIHFSHLLVLACIATNAHAAPNCKPGWEDFEDGADHSVCYTAEHLLRGKTCPTTKDLGPQEVQLNRTQSWYNASDNTFQSVLNCTCTSTIWNLLTVCAACQKWQLEDALNKSEAEWQILKDFENGTCAGFQSSGGGLQIAPDGTRRDPEWNSANLWAAGMTGTSFNLSIALAKVAPNRTTSASTTSSPTSSPNTDLASTPTTMANATSSKSGPNTGAIVGGVVGGIAFLGAIIGLLLFLHRRKRRARDVAPSSEFLKPEYYSSPPLLPVNSQRDSEYRDDIEEEAGPHSASRRLSWVGGMVVTRRHEDDRDEMLPPFTQGTYIGPSPHEKGHPERRHTDESDATATSNTHLLSSSSRPGTSE